MQDIVKICFINEAKKYYEAGLDYATKGSVGLDLRACMQEEKVVVKAGERMAFGTGIQIEIMKENVAGFVYSRSGLGAKKGLTVAQGVGVIDKDYRGEIIVVLLNTSKVDIEIEQKERIAQLVFQPAYQLKIEECESLSETDRGFGGFGHTGK